MERTTAMINPKYYLNQKVIEQAKLIRSLSDKYNDSDLTSLYFPSAEKEKRRKKWITNIIMNFRKR